MKGLIILGVLIAIMGGAGYAAGKFFAPPLPPEPAMIDVGEKKETIYKLPLGRFTVQVVKPTRFFNMRFEMDVFVAGAANFERMSSNLHRSEMREDVIKHLSNMVETTLWVKESVNTDPVPDDVAIAIARKLYQTYPMIRSAQISNFVSQRVDRTDG